MTGIDRNLFHKLKKSFAFFPAVTLLGARQVGKTTLSKQLIPEARYIDLENPEDLSLLKLNPGVFLQSQTAPLIIDEAQLYPEIFKILRGVIDQNRDLKGRFIITGSSSPDLLAHVSETLAGRVALHELGTLKANEISQKPLSLLYSLLESGGDLMELAHQDAPLTQEEIHRAWFLGGYPEPVLSEDSLFYQQWMDNYRQTYVNRDVAQLFPRLNKQAYQRFLSVLSKLSGTILNRRDIARSIEVTEGSIRTYLDIAEGTFMWRALPSFEKNVIKSVVKMPKGFIRDSGLLHHLLHIKTFDQLISSPEIGRSFESFVIEELLKGLEATRLTHWSPHYYRTRNGAEIDLILEGVNGSIPIEIKYSATLTKKQLIALNTFIEEHQLDFGVVLNQSRHVAWVAPKVLQIPVTWI